jgi:protocatechuate 3,4-dioxygenase beta subunit
MSSQVLELPRRHFVRATAFGLAAWTTPGLFAEELTRTPRMTEGPFYPDKLPLDTDNDLIVINDKTTPAVGEVTHLTGRVLTSSGSPVRGATVEIWQVDGNGVYLHSRSGGDGERDANFQGFGRFLTNNKGEYYFRTVKPVPYPGRSPHIHVLVKKGDRHLITTQLFVADQRERNLRDGIYRSMGDEKLQASVTADFRKLEDSKIGELTANFDIVLGATPEDLSH